MAIPLGRFLLVGVFDGHGEQGAARVATRRRPHSVELWRAGPAPKKGVNAREAVRREAWFCSETPKKSHPKEIELFLVCGSCDRGARLDCSLVINIACEDCIHAKGNLQGLAEIR